MNRSILKTVLQRPTFLKKVSLQQCSCASSKYSVTSSRNQFSSLTAPENDTDEFDDYYYKYPPDVTNNDEITIQKLDEIVFDMEVCLRFKNLHMPKTLSLKDWKKLLSCENSDRTSMYMYFYRKEKFREFETRDSEQRAHAYLPKAEKIERVYTTRDVYPHGIRLNTIFQVSVLAQKFKKLVDLEVIKAQILGPHLVLDCSYDALMTERELKICAKQISRTRVTNQMRIKPFNIIHCNANPDGRLLRRMKVLSPNLLNPDSAFNYTEKSFIDLFPADKLVYLSPHADTVLETFDRDTVYIIGAFVDLCPKDFISTGKAQHHGVKTAKLPLEKYLHWCKGTKSLTLERVVTIMLNIKDGISWEKAFTCILPINLSFSGVDDKYNFSDDNKLSQRYLVNKDISKYLKCGEGRRVNLD